MDANSPRWREVSPSEFSPRPRGACARPRPAARPRALPGVEQLRVPRRRRQVARGRPAGAGRTAAAPGRAQALPRHDRRLGLPLAAWRAQRGLAVAADPAQGAALKSVIIDALRALQPGVPAQAVPYVQEAVFLPAADCRVQLAVADTRDLFGLDGAERRIGLPSIARRLLEPAGVSPVPPLAADDELLAAPFEHIGFAVRREREVGSWRLVGPCGRTRRRGGSWRGGCDRTPWKPLRRRLRTTRTCRRGRTPAGHARHRAAAGTTEVPEPVARRLRGAVRRHPVQCGRHAGGSANPAVPRPDDQTG